MKLKRYVLDVRGKRNEWCFEVWVDLGLPVKAWCWMQDVGLVS